MPKQVKARAAQDKREERVVRQLAGSQHAPAAWIWHARMVVESWAGKTPDQIAAELHCHPQTVRIHVARFNQQGIEGLGVQPGSGRKPRLTEAERSVMVALPSQPPPGRLVTQRDGTLVARDESGSAQWSLDALVLAAKEAGIRVKRSQIRRIPAPGRGEGAADAQVGHASRQGLCPKRTAVVTHYPEPPRSVDDRLYR